MKRLMTVDEAKKVETVAFSVPFSLTTSLGIKREVKFCFVSFSFRLYPAHSRAGGESLRISC